jgi:uncharacterized protein (DUF1778 family)
MLARTTRNGMTRADEALADRRTFGLDAMQWKAFMAAPSPPPAPGGASSKRTRIF